MNILDSVAQDYLKEDVPAFNVGDTVRVHVKIKEGNRERKPQGEFRSRRDPKAPREFKGNREPRIPKKEEE